MLSECEPRSPLDVRRSVEIVRVGEVCKVTGGQVELMPNIRKSVANYQLTKVQGILVGGVSLRRGGFVQVRLQHYVGVSTHKKEAHPMGLRYGKQV